VISDGSPNLIPAIQVYRSQGLASRPHPRLEAGDLGNRPVSWMPFKSDSWSVCERVDEPPAVQSRRVMPSPGGLPTAAGLMWSRESLLGYDAPGGQVCDRVRGCNRTSGNLDRVLADIRRPTADLEALVPTVIPFDTTVISESELVRFCVENIFLD
jgi:hypothetical protein